MSTADNSTSPTPWDMCDAPEGWVAPGHQDSPAQWDTLEPLAPTGKTCW